jgi:hypothetical protein
MNSRSTSVPRSDALEIVGVGPRSGICREASLDRVAVDVSAEVRQMSFFVRMKGLESTLKQGAAVPIAFVEGFGVAVEDMLGQQACRHVSILAEEEMVVGGHQTAGDDGDAIPGCTALDLSQDEHIVVGLSEKSLTPCAAVVDVVVSSLNKLSSTTWHDASRSPKRLLRRRRSPLLLSVTSVIQFPAFYWSTAGHTNGGPHECV